MQKMQKKLRIRTKVQHMLQGEADVGDEELIERRPVLRRHAPDSCIVFSPTGSKSMLE